MKSLGLSNRSGTSSSDLLRDLHYSLEMLERHKERNPVDYLTLTRTQAAFILDDSELKLFSGGTGSGKTSAMAIDLALQMMGEHPLQKKGKMIKPPIFARAMAPSIQDNVDKDLRPEISKWLRQDYIESYDSKHRILYTKENCPTRGSRVEFMSYDQPVDVYAGGTRHVLICNEPPSWIAYNESRARLRAKGARTMLGMTPEKNNPNVRWIFLKLLEPGLCSVHYGGSRELTELMHGDGAEAIMNRVFGHLTPEEREYRELGKFPTMGGVVFPQFKKSPAPQGHLTQPFAIPDDFMTVMCMDYHKRKPCYAVWCAISPKDLHFYYRSYKSKPEATIQQISEDISKLEKGRIPFCRLIDPSSAKEQTRMDSADRTPIREFLKYRSGGRPLVFREATRNFQMSIDAIEARLRFDASGIPGMMFFQNEMTEAVDEMMHYMWDDPPDHREVKDLKESVIKKDDHFVDCVRYIETMRFRYRHPGLYMRGGEA